MTSENATEADAWMDEASRGQAAVTAAGLDVDSALRTVQAAANERLRLLAQQKPPSGVGDVVQYIPRADRVDALAPHVGSENQPGTSAVDAVFARLKTTAFHELVETALSGDRAAAHTVVAWVHPAIVRYCRARVGRTGSAFSMADDVAQETMLAIMRALPRYTDGPESFMSFVYGIATHKVADFYRRRARESVDPVAEIPEEIDEEPGPEQVTLRGELRSRMANLLDTVAPRQREVLILRLVVGLTAEETATALGMTATAVRVVQHRAIARIRRSVTAADWL